MARGVMRVLGLMSGTSLDGVDAAELVTDGMHIIAFGETGYRPYSEAERETIRAALGLWPADREGDGGGSGDGGIDGGGIGDGGCGGGGSDGSREAGQVGARAGTPDDETARVAHRAAGDDRRPRRADPGRMTAMPHEDATAPGAGAAHPGTETAAGHSRALPSHDAKGARPGADARARAVRDAAEVVECAHAELIGGFARPELIGFHGQTLAHDPGGRGTHQAGDGALLAAALGVDVVWDFRSNDVALGGQGAPLAPFYHFACARWIGADAPLAFLNLGGVGNLTWVDPRKAAPEAAGACLAFDTGPANAPIDDLLLARRGLARDEGGALAAAGRADEAVIAAFLEHPHFYRMPPKSLDRNAFAQLGAAIASLSDADAAATLTAAAAAAVIRGAEHFPAPPAGILVAGGGRHNPTLMAAIQAGFDCPVLPVESVGLDGDMLEAQAFAFLAARVLHGLPTSAPGTTGVRAAVGGGRISRAAADER